MLSLDLSRLESVAARLGLETAGGFGTRDRLKRINKALGERLAGGDADTRSALAQAVADADASLPAAVRMASKPVKSAEIDHLRQDGCLDLGRRLGTEQAAATEKHLLSRPLRIARRPHHWEPQVPSLGDLPRTVNFGCYDYLDLWSSPHLMELACQDDLLDLVQAYLGCTPTLCSLNAYWAQPERPADPEVQAFHRDLGDGRSLAVLSLLTPVEMPEEGGHFYVQTSHEPERLEASLRAEGVGIKLEYLMAGTFVGPMSMRLFSRSARRFIGPAGTTLCVDPFGLHRSIAPRSRPKLLLELRFGTFFNERLYDLELGRRNDVRRALRKVLIPVGAVVDPIRSRQARAVLRRIPATPRHRYIFRYMIHELSAEL
jgi:hypothetical protein